MTSFISILLRTKQIKKKKKHIWKYPKFDEQIVSESFPF